MISVDPRIGSADLVPLLKARGVPAELTKLEYGDAAWLGNGPDGRPVPCGLERKRLGDLLSCITDSRFSGHQLPGLLATYEVVYLLIEDEYYGGLKHGELCLHGFPVPRRKKGEWGHWTYAAVEKWLATMRLCCGVTVLRPTRDAQATARAIAIEYDWWTGKTWDEHRAHLGFDESGAGGRRVSLAPSALKKPSVMRTVLAQIPNIGWEFSEAAEREFGSLTDAVLAADERWASLKTGGHAGRKPVRLGDKRAREIVKALRGE